MLRLSNLQVKYGQVPALRGLDMAVGAGEIVALIGTNGAGKSTALKAISGLVSLSAGTIELDGLPLAGLSPERRVELGIIHVPEGRQIFPRLTVEENLKSAHTRLAPAPASGRRAIVSITCFRVLPSVVGK